MAASPWAGINPWQQVTGGIVDETAKPSGTVNLAPTASLPWSQQVAQEWGGNLTQTDPNQDWGPAGARSAPDYALDYGPGDDVDVNRITQMMRRLNADTGQYEEDPEAMTRAAIQAGASYGTTYPGSSNPNQPAPQYGGAYSIPVPGAQYLGQPSRYTGDARTPAPASPTAPAPSNPQIPSLRPTSPGSTTPPGGGGGRLSSNRLGGSGSGNSGGMVPQSGGGGSSGLYAPVGSNPTGLPAGGGPPTVPGGGGRMGGAPAPDTSDYGYPTAGTRVYDPGGRQEIFDAAGSGGSPGSPATRPSGGGAFGSRPPVAQPPGYGYIPGGSNPGAGTTPPVVPPAPTSGGGNVGPVSRPTFGGGGGSLPGPIPPGSSYPWTPPRTPNAGTAGGVAPTGVDFSEKGPNNIPNGEEQAQQNRLLYKNWWDTLDADTQATQNQFQNEQQYYTDTLQGGPGGYGQILAGEGGYGVPEQERILQQELVKNGLVTQEQLQDLNLTQSEMLSILGDPYAARNIIQGKLQQLGTMDTEAAARQREAYQQMGSALDAVAGRQSLGVDSGYNEGQMGNINALADDYSVAVDPSRLSLSDEFQQGYKWTPQDTERLASQAGRTVGFQGQARNDALDRESNAYGNVSPLARVAAGSRNQIQSDIAAADAMTSARLQGKGRELEATKTREQMRLDAQYGLTDRQIAAAESIAGKRLSQGEAYEVLRLQTERDKADRAASAATQTGAAKLATEKGIGESQQDLGRYEAGVNADLTKYGEAASSQRNVDLTKNRQDMAQYGINTAYSQGMGAGQAQSDRWSQILAEKKKEEQEGRGFLSGQQARAQEGATTTRQQRLGAGSTGMGGINAATNASISANTPWTSVFSTLMG